MTNDPGDPERDQDPRIISDPSDTAAVLVVGLTDLSVRRASSNAVAWLGLPKERLLERSLMLSLPHLGQALTVAIAGGLSPLPQPLVTDVAKPDLTPLSVFVRRLEDEAIIDLQVPAADHAGGRTHSVPTHISPGEHPEDAVAVRGRFTALRNELALLRALAEAHVTPTAEERHLHDWLWQAEVALTRMIENFGAVEKLIERRDTPSPQATRL